MTEKTKQKSAWRDERADVLRENLKKRKQMQKARAKAEAEVQGNEEGEV